MKQKVLSIGIIALIFIIGIITYQLLRSPSSANTVLNITPMANMSINNTTCDNYISQHGGNLTRLCLVNSSLYYVASEKDYNGTAGTSFGKFVETGEPIIVINGTVRNDYDQDYYFFLEAYLYNASGGRVGDIQYSYTTPGGFGFRVIFAPNHSTALFEIMLKYNKTDVASYVINTSKPMERFLP